jgi:hypothetical protein
MRMISDLLKYPFSATPHPNGQAIASHTYAWIRQFQIVSEEELVKFQAIDAPGLAVHSASYSQTMRLCLLSDWIAWLFVLDDFCDTGKLDTLGEVPSFFKELIDLFNSPIRVHTHIPLHSALIDLSLRTQAFLTPETFVLFGNALCEYFNAIMWEEENRTCDRVPNLETYLSKRVHAGAVYIIFLSANFLLEKSFPSKLFLQENVQLMENYAARAICIANDLFSYRKEAQDDNIHNIVFVNEALLRTPEHQCESERCKLEARSLLKGIQLHNELIDSFIEISSSFEENSDESHYAKILKQCLQGVFNWTLLSRRYEDVAIAKEDFHAYESQHFVASTLNGCE